MLARATTIASLLTLVLLVAGCGNAGDVEPTSPDALEDPGPTTDGAAGDDPAEDGAAGSCLEGTPDCADADLSGGSAPPPDLDASFDLEAARRDAESLLGQPEEEVLQLWGDVRLGRHGDEEFMLTFDLRPGRKTIETDDDGTGTFRVVEVVLETEDGTETFTAG